MKGRKYQKQLCWQNRGTLTLIERFQHVDGAAQNQHAVDERSRPEENADKNWMIFGGRLTLLQC